MLTASETLLCSTESSQLSAQGGQDGRVWNGGSRGDICIQTMTPFIIQQKLTQHCKAVIYARALSRV